MDVISLKLSPRAVRGKKVKRLRRQGEVPVHLYGRDIQPGSFQIDAQVLRRILPRVGTNVPLSVEIEGQDGDNICFVREVQRHPVTEDVLHVDFMRVDVSRVVRAEVPIVLVGTSPAVRQLSGTLLQSLQSTLVESLPMNVPPSVRADISVLDDFEKAIYVRDLSINPGVTLLTDVDELIARVSPPRIELADEEAEEGVEDGAAAEAAEDQAEQEGGGASPRGQGRPPPSS